MSKKSNKSALNVSDAQKEFLIKATKNEIESLENKLAEAQKMLDQLLGNSTTNTIGFKWSNLVVQTIQELGKLCTAVQIQEKIWSNHKETYLKGIERRTMVSRVSGSLGQMTGKKVLRFNDSIGNSLYGLPNWFEGDKIKSIELIPEKYKSTFRDFGIDIPPPPILNYGTQAV